MIDALINTILDFLIKIFVHPEIVVVLVAILPIVEARMAIPIALGYKLGFFKSWLFSFLGSSLIAPLLLLILIPFIKWLAKTRAFKKLGSFLYDKFEKKSREVKTGDVSQNGDAKAERKNELKKMLGVFVFVAIPLPLTGIWTGCAVASILGMKYRNALAAVVAGNMVASLIILLLCALFEPYINIITTVLAIIAIAVVISLIVKMLLHKPTEATDKTAENTQTDEKN